MTESEIIAALEREWEEPDGFFARLRGGDLDEPGIRRTADLLQKIEPTDPISRRLVSLVWYIPLFMGWQRERVCECGGSDDALERAINGIQTILEEKLGLP